MSPHLFQRRCKVLVQVHEIAYFSRWAAVRELGPHFAEHTLTQVGADMTNSKHSNSYVPLNIPSSTKTIVGLSPEEEAELAQPVPPRRAQRTLLGAGPEHERAVEAFLSTAARNVPIAAPPRRAGRTLVGLAPEVEPPAEKEPPSMGPASFGPLSLGPASLGPSSLSAPRMSTPSIADLPFERPMIAALGVAAAVAVWALMMLFLLSL